MPKKKEEVKSKKFKDTTRPAGSVLERLVSCVFVIFHPFYWMQNNKLHNAWDRELSYLLKTDKFTNITAYHAEIGGFKLWIANHPYSSFTVEIENEPPFIHTVARPRRATIHKAYQKLLHDWHES